MKQTLMHSTWIILFAGLGALCLAQAAEIPSRGPIPFEVFDADRDGTISKQEFMQAHEKRQALREAQGRNSRALPAPQMFNGFDTDGNGALSPAELSAGQRLQQQGRISMQQPGLPVGEGRGLGRGRDMPAFSDFDANQDGLLSEDEFIEGRAKRISERVKQGYQMRGLQNARPFSELDTDGDGLIDPAEFAAAQARHRQQRHN